jgi:hypothetical protein
MNKTEFCFLFLVVHGNELSGNHEEVNHLEDYDANALTIVLITVPDDGSVNHALQ